MDANSVLVRLRSAILYAYTQLKPETAAEREGNERIVSHLTAWFNSPNRSISDAAVVCCEKYLTAELDSATPGNRGLGRMTDYEPRFAAKHRAVFQKRTDAAALLKPLFVDHLFLGYWFLEYLLEAFGGRQLPRDPKVVSSHEELFSQWVPMLYSSAGAASFDSEMEKQSGEAAYWRVKGLWMNATLAPINIALNELGISTDDKDKLLLLRYFDAGLVLRLLESRPLSKVEQMDVVTGGGYSAEKAGILGNRTEGFQQGVGAGKQVKSWARERPRFWL